MKKKVLSAILSVLIITSAFILPVHAEPDEQGDNLSSMSIEDYLSTMSTEDKISQMIMPVFRYREDEEGNKVNVTEITDNIEETLKKHSFSGVILMGQNTPTIENTVRLIDSMQKANAAGGERPQLLIATDQEGGNVTRLGQGTVTPGNMALGAADAQRYPLYVPTVEDTATLIGNELKALGVTVDFAPSVDVNSNPANPVIGVRSFSDDPEIVSYISESFMRELGRTGVIPALKHFPGHGDTETDSHTGLPCVNKSFYEISSSELVPFRGCINNGAQIIMTAHIQYPQIDSYKYYSYLTGEEIYLPATLSKTIITDILRVNLHYRGVVITDALEMDAIKKYFDKFEVAKLAIDAGVDIMLMPFDPCTREDFEEVDNYISALAEMVDNNDISMEMIDAAVTRILTLKKNNGLFSVYDGSDIEERVEYAINNVGTKENHDKEWELTKKAITLIKNDDRTLPLTTPDQKTVILVPYDDETIPMNYAVRKLTQDGKLPEGAVVESYSYRYKTLEDMLPTIEGADNVIFLSELYNASALQGDIPKMADTICETIHDRGGKFIVMSVNLPYDVARFPDADAIMIAYLAVSMPVDPEDKETEIQKYGPNMPVALYMMFSEEDAPTGRLPVNIPKLDENYSYTDTVLYERGFGITYLSDPTGEYSAEYMSSPYYEKLLLALEDSSDKTTMEKTLAAALSQEGYKSYSTNGINTDAARTDGLLWTGKELRMTDGTGNTEYIRWAQSVILGRTGRDLYLDCDWCAIFASWSMYQAGYYTEEQLKKYYYSYYADPRAEYDADAWITAFCFEQENVWYTPLAARKLEAYDWNTYYNTDVDPFEIPYRPGGLIFFSWDASGNYFDHVAIVVSYDPETHVLTYSNGNSDGQVITKQMDLDTEEEFYGQPLAQNSSRIMAYAEYDEILPLEQKEITADQIEILWYKDAEKGIRIQTDSASKIASVFIDDEYLGSNLESNMVFNNGYLSIGKSELIGLETGAHDMRLVFDDGVVSIPLTIEEKAESSEAPSVETSAPSESSEESSEPSDEPSESSDEPSESSDKPSEPSDEPSEPSAEPSESSDEPSEPSDEPSEPSDEPSEPSDEPSEPSDEPSEPSDEPSQHSTVIISDSDTPKTSDNSCTGMIIFVVISSVCAVIVLFRRKEKE